MTFALTVGEGQATLWWVALAVGAVVIGVVIALLTLLSRLLRDVGASVTSLQEAFEGLDRDAEAGRLPQTAALLTGIRDEIRLHHDLLSR